VAGGADVRAEPPRRRVDHRLERRPTLGRKALLLGAPLSDRLARGLELLAPIFSCFVTFLRLQRAEPASPARRDLLGWATTQRPAQNHKSKA
jgi:hypothetical protein